MRSHNIPDFLGEDRHILIRFAAEIAVREDPQQQVVGSGHHGRSAVGMGHGENGFLDGLVRGNFRQPVAGPHNIGHPHSNSASDGARRMQTSVIFLGETAEMQQCHGKGVAHYQSRGRTGRRCEIERTGFARNPDRHMQIGELGERGFLIACETGDFHAETFCRKNNAEKFIAFTAVTDC